MSGQFRAWIAHGLQRRVARPTHSQADDERPAETVTVSRLWSLARELAARRGRGSAGLREAPQPATVATVDDERALFERYRALCEKVDAFAARVHARYGGELSCRPGCDGCCKVRLTITEIEAAAIAALLAALAPRERERIRARAQTAPEGRCAALDEQGRCAIYEARPLVCRSHGLAIRTRDPRGLPVVQACALNFVERGPAVVEPSFVLDQQTLSTVLFALDAALARLRSRAASARVDLASSLRGDGAEPSRRVTTNS